MARTDRVAAEAERATWMAVVAVREARRAVESLSGEGFYAAGLAGELRVAMEAVERAHRSASLAVMDEGARFGAPDRYGITL